ncbi:MAG: LamG domain-containing protein [Planctomycetota bacterium]|jgi:hypothetical protein
MFPKAVRPLVILLTLAFLSVANADLKIDFSSTTQDGGPHNQPGWQSYEAGHEVAADFITRSYAAFGTTVSVTPSWPNTTDNRVQQMIDRGAGFDGNWNNAAGDLDLVTDFLGIDTRTGNGGNGDWDGTVGTPTYMLLTIGGLPAGDYKWTSFHHDTEHVHGPFSFEISTDGGMSFTQLPDGYMTDSTAGGNPDSLATEVGPDAYTLSSTYTMSFTANGTDDVVMRFAPYSGIAVHRQIWGINGLEIGNPKLPSNPTPLDGSVVPPTDEAEDGRIYMRMTFEPGLGAVSHTAYFSDNYDDVANHVAEVSIGAPPFPAIPTTYYVGLDDSNLPDHAREEIEAGTTYYWTVVESDGVEDHFGPVWSYTIIPEHAWDPTPADGDVTIDPDPNATTSWQIGHVDTTDYTVSYDVYYGSVRADVEAETSAVVSVSGTTAEIGPLAADTTYYWKVNTVLTLIRPPFTETAITGEIWQFKTIPTVPIEDEDLIGWWKLDGDVVPGMAFDSSGHANHGTLVGDPEFVAGKVDGALEFDGAGDIVDIKQNTGLPIYNNGTDGAYSITMWVKGGPQPDMRVFSEGSRSSNNPLFNLGTQNAGTTGQFDVYIRPTGLGHTFSVAEPFDETWHHIAWADANGMASVYIDGELDDTDFSYTRATLALNTTSIGGILRAAASHFFTGQIDDVRAYNRILSVKEIKILAGHLAASNPSPSYGDEDVSRKPTLSWSEGVYAASVNGNILYYGPDEAAVANRTATSVTLTDAIYVLPLTLDLGQTFYWAVDTVNGVDKWEGDVWSFTVTNWLLVDDMETYTPWTMPGNNIFEAYRDGMGNCTAGNGNDTGANLTENMDTAYVWNGFQSMMYEYDNDGLVYNPCTMSQGPRTHLYSKIEAQVAGLPSGIGTDWTVQGVKALSLRFYGQATNGIEPMWVQLSDGTKAYGNKVTYGDYDEDPADITEESWHEWFIDMGDFGVDLKNVVSLVIGIGTEGSATPGGAGKVYFDDFRLYTPVCMPQRAKPAGDFDSSCKVDYPDVAVLFDNWLLQDVAEVTDSGWMTTDVGDVNALYAGSFTDLGGGAFTMSGSGADIWGTADAFFYRYRSLSGDGKLTARVTDIAGPGTHDWRKGGVMIRETLDAGSRHAFMTATPSGGNGISFQRRLTTDGASASSSKAAPQAEPPMCVRIARKDNTFRGFYNTGDGWTQMGPAVTIDMPENVYIGFAVTSHEYNNSAAISFDNVCSTDFVAPDLVMDNVINFEDYAEMLSNWLVEVKYPQ